MKPGITGDGLRLSMRWLAEPANPLFRGQRLTAWLLAMHGLRFFPDCRTLDDVCEQQRISQRTLYAYLRELRDVYGISHYIRAPDLQPAEPCNSAGTNDERESTAEILQ
jgi:hypothetical protein